MVFGKINKAFRKSFPKPKISSGTSGEHQESPRNVLEILRSVSTLQYALFISGYLCWIADAMDFYIVSLTIKELANHFDISSADVTQALTLSLLFRPFGALIFGLLGDRYGRKWPLVANMLFLAVFEILTVFVKGFVPFLVVRSLFGVGMGGVWGLASACAMENLPLHAKGLFSGIFQPGFSVGVILSVLVNMAIQNAGLSFVYLFYVGAAFALVLAIIRGLLPESQVFIDKKKKELELKKNGTLQQQQGPSFFQLFKNMLKEHWLLCLWTIGITTGLSGLANGCQAIYPIFLTETKSLPESLKNLTIILANLGGMVGPFLTGYLSQLIGRKLMIVLAVAFTLIATPLAILPSTAEWLLTGYVLVQAGFQGAWGVAPVYLYELAPAEFKAFFPGITYQLGVMISSPAAEYEGNYAESHRTADGHRDYGSPMIHVMVFCASLVILLLSFSYERESSEQEVILEEDTYGDNNVSKPPSAHVKV